MKTPQQIRVAMEAQQRAGGGAAPSAPAGLPDPKAETEPEPLVISPNMTSAFEHRASRWMCIVPKGTTPQDLDMKPGPFDLIAPTCPLHAYDDIRAVEVGGGRVMDLVVVHVNSGGRAWCRVVNDIHVPEMSEVGQVAVPAGYEIVMATPGDGQDGWLVRRLSDGALINGGGAPMFDYHQALAYLRNHPAVRDPSGKGLKVQYI